MAYFEPYPDAHHRYRSWNHVSGLALMEDERGYPTLNSSQLPTEADVAIAHKQVRGIVVPTRIPNPLYSTSDSQPLGLEAFVRKEHPKEADRIVVKDTLEELVHHTDSTLNHAFALAGMSIW